MKVSDEQTIVKDAYWPVPARGQSRVPAPVVKTDKRGKFWQMVIIGGVQGILLDSAVNAFASHLYEEKGWDDDAPEAESTVEETVETVSEVFEEPSPEASEAITEPAADADGGVSFSEAFAAARAEMGPGGVFIWNGSAYSTYYEEEWENMTDEQKDAFAESYYEVSSEAVHADVSSEGEHYVEVHDYDGDGVIDVALVDEDGDGYMESAFVDNDGDGYADVVLIDENGDGHADIVLGESDFLAMNDADTSSFA